MDVGCNVAHMGFVEAPRFLGTASMAEVFLGGFFRRPAPCLARQHAALPWRARTAVAELRPASPRALPCQRLLRIRGVLRQDWLRIIASAIRIQGATPHLGTSLP